MKNVGLLGDADKTVEVDIAKRTWPYEVNPPGRNKLHIISYWYSRAYIVKLY
jgi:hypothetical protein